MPCSHEHLHTTQRLLAPAAAGFQTHHCETASCAFEEFPILGSLLLSGPSEYSSIDIGCIGPRFSTGCQGGSEGDIHRHLRTVKQWQARSKDFDGPLI